MLTISLAILKMYGWRGLMFTWPIFLKLYAEVKRIDFSETTKKVEYCFWFVMTTDTPSSFIYIQLFLQTKY